MITLRLAQLVEAHSEEITRKLIRAIRRSPRTAGMQKISELELRTATIAVFQHLREWLLTKTDADIEVRYRWLGEHWASQGATLAGCCWTLILTKAYLWEFLQEQALVLNGAEIYGEMELLLSLNQFFDSALCHLVEGYEQSERSKVKHGEGEKPDWRDVNIATWVP
jgi:hypothetical protein